MSRSVSSKLRHESPLASRKRLLAGSAADRALLRLQARDFALAERDAKAALSHDADHVGALEVLAQATWRTGRPEQALGVVRRLIALQPEEDGYRSLEAACLQALGRYGEAIRSMLQMRQTGSDTALDILESIQQRTAKVMMTVDPVFRAHAAQDPASAYALRGLGAPPKGVLSATPGDWFQHARATVRPS